MKLILQIAAGIVLGAIAMVIIPWIIIGLIVGVSTPSQHKVPTQPKANIEGEYVCSKEGGVSGCRFRPHPQ
jgi:hypothetical protein